MRTNQSIDWLSISVTELKCLQRVRAAGPVSLLTGDGQLTQSQTDRLQSHGWLSVGVVLTRTESDLLDPLLQLNWVSSVQWVQLACFGPGRAVCPGWVRAGQPRRTTALIRWPPRAIRPGGRPGPARPAHWPSHSENQKSSVNVSRLIPADGRRFIVT